jgi:hypothetical protein
VPDFSNRDAVEKSVSNDGSVLLEWSVDGREVELQQAAGPEFEDAVTRYTGGDSASALTGLAEGVHWFRIRDAGDTQWSEPLRVEVDFVSNRTLVIYLSLGGLVVLLTVGAIVSGFLRTVERSGS